MISNIEDLKEAQAKWLNDKDKEQEENSKNDTLWNDIVDKTIELKKLNYTYTCKLLKKPTEILIMDGTSGGGPLFQINEQTQIITITIPAHYNFTDETLVIINGETMPMWKAHLFDIPKNIKELRK